jgi:hypothetical protein
MTLVSLYRVHAALEFHPVPFRNQYHNCVGLDRLYCNSRVVGDYVESGHREPTLANKPAIHILRLDEKEEPWLVQQQINNISH